MDGWLESLIAFIGDDTRQGALSVIGGVCTALALGAWAAFKYLKKTPDVRTPHGEIRLSIEQYDERLRNREAEVEKALQLAHGDDKRRLEAERDELQRRISDISAAYSSSIKKVRELEKTLSSVGGDIPRRKLHEAMTTLRSGDTSSAELVFREVLEEQQQHLEIASAAAFGLGLIAEEQVDWVEASRHFSRSLGIYEYEGNLLQASTYLWRAGQYREAAAVSFKLLKKAVENYGENHEKTAGILNNLAAQLYDLGETDRAFEYLNRSLNIKRSLGQQEDPDFAASLANLANMYLVQEKYTLSTKYQREALDIIRRTIGTANDHFSAVANALGESLRLCGDFTGAEVNITLALETDRSIHGNDHPLVARDLNFLAKVHIETGRLEDAKRELLEARRIAEKSLGPYHPNTAAIAANIIEVLNRLPRTSESDRMAAEIHETYDGGLKVDEAFAEAMGAPLEESDTAAPDTP